MNSSEKLNQFVQENSASILYMDENLILQKEIREDTIFWGSVYGSDFVEMPDKAFTSEPAYRTWCLKTSGMMPVKRKAADFDSYIRARIEKATVREVLPGTEFGVEVDETIEEVLAICLKNLPNMNSGVVDPTMSGHSAWLETIDPSRGQEVIIKINSLMKKINAREARGMTEGWITRRNVCKRLVHYGRKVSGREATVGRLRCAYALPGEFIVGGFEALQKVRE